MSNKRDLKKAIRSICAELFTECASATLYCEPEQRENGEALLASILAMTINYLCRVSHPEPGMPPKNYYKDLIDNFNKEVESIADQIGTLS